MSVILYTTFSTLPGIAPSVYLVSRKFIFHLTFHSNFFVETGVWGVWGVWEVWEVWEDRERRVGEKFK
jgi:hypothetical protein